MIKVLGQTTKLLASFLRREIPDLDRKGLRNFAWVFSIFVAGFFGVILPWVLKHDWPWEPWAIAAAIFSWGLVAPNTIIPFYRTWMRFGFFMNAIVSRFTLGVVFYAVIFPTGLLLRSRRKDPLQKRWNDELQSYRIVSQKSDSKDMERPF